jgi:hypothetical protein
MRFGKHRGQPIASIEDGYLYWLLSCSWVHEETQEQVRDELRRRAPRRRSWRPVVRAIYGRQLLSVIGQGPYAVIQTCGIERRWLTVLLCGSADEALARRPDDCGYDGGRDGCDDRIHFAMDLTDWTPILDDEAIE